ncbi:MAG TPA: GMC family oxidoreductase [Solimonas sp.]|nr:GMC family oxidoreductase [Solimonas sp.]
MKYDYDYLIVGSGFGGSVSALRLSEKGYKVGVMEMGRRWTPENLPKTNWKLWRYLWAPVLGLRGFLSLRMFKHVMILHGNAVGGGSITYAQTLLVPPPKVWSEGSWSGLEDWDSVMPGHYATAKRMLGVTQNRLLGPADHALKKMAEAAGVGDTFYRTDVGVFFGKPGDAPGTRYPDPYFGGAGPERSSCTGCGGCMVGCRHGAKNTLDQNYLYLAEKLGTQVHAETRVIDVRPLNGIDGADGYEVTVAPTFGLFRKPRRYLARNVVLSASSLGTQGLLMRLKDIGSLPAISDELGKRVRTNAESILGVRYPWGKTDMSKGVAIGSGIYIDEHTHIEAVRYPRGSDSMGTLLTMLTGGKPGVTRPLYWLAAVLKLLLASPLKALRFLLPFGFARETVIFLCMQTLDGHIDMRWKRRWWWPFGKTMVSEGEPIPTFIPEANAFAEKAAKATGGIPMSSMSEIFFNVPMTAHCMGGCAMSDSPQRGVIDAQNRVFGYRNLYVVDGSMLGANLGVNPSLTITALAERAMSFIPSKQKQQKVEARAVAVEA